MPLEPEDIQLRSEEVQEILGRPPHFLVRSGITITLIVVAFLILLSCLIGYPDVVTGEVEVTTEQPPIALSSFATGKIEALLVENNQPLKKGQVIALIENTADYGDVNYLEQIMDSIVSGSNVELSELSMRLNLGEIQEEYGNYVSAVNALIFFQEHDLEGSKAGNLSEERREYDEQYAKLKRQLDYLKKERDLAEEQFEMYQKLFEEEVASKVELRDAEQDYIEKERAFEKGKAEINSNRINLNELENQVFQNSYDQFYKDNETTKNYMEARQLLQAKLIWWKKKYVIASPIAGVISFESAWTENQFVEEGKPLFTIVPPESNVIAKMTIPLKGSGKIEKGQKVKLNLLDYPASEFGFVLGKVKQINAAPSQELTYLVEVELPDGLETTYQKMIGFRPRMQGTAEIITEKKKIISRILEQFKHLFDREH